MKLSEKNEPLTWEDIRDIVYSMYAVNAIWREKEKGVPNMYTIEYYQDILNRFNDIKREKENKK